MKYIIGAVLCLILLPVFPAIRAEAAESAYSQLTSADLPLPESVRAELSDSGITPDDPEAVLTLSPSDLLNSVTNALKREIRSPVRILISLLSVTAVAALLSGTGSCTSEMQPVFSKICILIYTGTAAAPLLSSISRAADTLEEGKMLMAGFIPVYSGFLIAGGSVAGAASYQLLILFLTEGVMQLTSTVLFPMIRSAAALGIADAINPSLKLGEMIQGLRSAVNWIMGTVMALFAALLTVRSFVSAAADSVGAKTVKLLSSGLIPIVGPAVSEAYGTVSGSIRLVGSGVGAFGILAICLLVLPPVISVMLYRLVFRISRILADITDTEALQKLFCSAEQVLSAVLAMLICYAVMLIFSTAVMLMLCCKI